MFNQIFGHLVIQSGWHVKLTISAHPPSPNCLLGVLRVRPDILPHWIILLSSVTFCFFPRLTLLKFKALGRAFFLDPCFFYFLFFIFFTQSISSAIRGGWCHMLLWAILTQKSLFTIKNRAALFDLFFRVLTFPLASSSSSSLIFLPADFYFKILLCYI